MQRLAADGWRLFYHPPWTLPELEAYRQQCSPDESAEDVAQDFLEYGGRLGMVQRYCHCILAQERCPQPSVLGRSPDGTTRMHLVVSRWWACHDLARTEHHRCWCRPSPSTHTMCRGGDAMAACQSIRSIEDDVPA